MNVAERADAKITRFDRLTLTSGWLNDSAGQTRHIQNLV